MRLLIVGAFQLASLILSGPVAAAEFMKAEVTPVEIRAGGALKGCGLEYSGVFLDHTYRNGELSGVSGSLNLMRNGKHGVGLFFKVGLVDWLDGELKQAVVAKIAKAYVKSGKYVAPETPIPCDNPNGFCGGSGGGATLDFFTSAMQNSIQIGFNRVPDGLDILLTLPPSEDVKFMECTVEILSNARDGTPVP